MELQPYQFSSRGETASTQPATAYISAPGDAELMRKMNETIDNQRDTIRSKNMEIDSLRNDLQAMKEQIERLTTFKESVRETLETSMAQIHTLATETVELQTELRVLRHTDETPLQSEQTDITVEQNGNDEEEENRLMMKMMEMMMTMMMMMMTMMMMMMMSAETQRQERADKENKDPDRPRYTRAELWEVLDERNILKDKVCDLQEELKIYKAGTRISKFLRKFTRRRDY